MGGRDGESTHRYSRGPIVLGLVVLLPLGGGTPVLVQAAPSTTAPPAVDLGQVFPGDQANTIHGSQPLIARFTEDDRSRVVAGSVVFRLTDLGTRDTRVFEGDAVRYDAATGFAKTEPASLTPGHEYRVELTAADSTGNAGDWSWRFRAMSLEVSTAAASIAGSAGEPTGTTGPGTVRSRRPSSA